MLKNKNNKNIKLICGMNWKRSSREEGKKWKEQGISYINLIKNFN